MLNRTRTAILLAAALAVGCAPSEPPEAGGVHADATGDTAAATPPDEGQIRPPAMETALTSGDTLAGHPSWTEEDWQVLERTVRRARAEGWDGLPIGDRIARIGETFVGTAYIPQTLDPEGPERLVVNLRALDCVTYVENMLALALFVRHAPPDVLADRSRALELYGRTLTHMRYRDGELSGYPSRLHYFSEWISDNQEKGLLRNVTRELGGVLDPEPITFMTSHRDAYRQLESDAFFAEIGRIEARLNAGSRHYIPQEGVKAVADDIRSGDIIAATSTLEGLDIAHTGIALWKDGALHLMHAPLVGKDVEISELPLADRLLGIRAQDGIMVARPLEQDALPGA